MVYKLAEEDKLCGVIYPTYEGFSPIPKATCEMLESKCEQTIIVKCGESSEEDKKPESQSGSASASASESTSESNSVSDSVSDSTSVSESTSESNSTSESQASTSESTSESTSTESTSESTSTESTSTSESTSVSESTTESTTTSTSTSVSTSESASSSTESSNTPEEPKPSPEPQPEPVPTIDLLEVLPRVEDKFSKIITKDGQVVEVPEVSNEDKRAFEDKIINELKAKLPEGTVVEAVLEGPKYEKGSEVLSGKTNYVLNVRTTLNGVVSEQTYNVPHTEEAPKEEPEAPELSEEEINKVINTGINLGTGVISGDIITVLTINGKTPTESILEEASSNSASTIENILNEGRPDTSKYKVELKFTQLKKVGDSIDPLVSYSSVFSALIRVTKPNGEVIEKVIPVTTYFIDTL